MPVNQKATAAQQSRTRQPPQDKTMKKLILTLCLTAAAATSAAASDEGRIAALEARIADLEYRIAALEARIADLEYRIAVLERNGNTAYRPNRSVYVCSITPFQKTFEAADNNEGLARSKVRRACNAETSAMFCEDRDIRCKRFD
ncbi:hypothetical protein NEIELOOT_01404 [Neisseria elongata subsp. glycolytica ATCC 29315]|uniref:Periplasmic protein n=2 Tax=Neisseria elongata subsp. glycolytica ATCC 29315 TaxID=546263 RepID=D4DQR4_NEIEG|nr:hypothetical protein NEIELOOT_01404 [Neisseria elongata subsp. glycolytica ATCC 29315]